MASTITPLPAQEIASRLAEIAKVYLAIYALPPEEGPRFAAGLTEHAGREGFRFCAASDEETGAIVGFAYGFTGLPGQVWRDSLAAALGPELVGEWLTGHFEFAEFGVVPAWRQQGIGARLHDALFTGLRQRRAVLTVRAKQQPARGFYERRGWRTLHHDFFTPWGRGPYAVLGCELL